jgi:DNA processing protein
LLILDSLFERADLTWPANFEARDAVRVRDTDDIWKALG